MTRKELNNKAKEYIKSLGLVYEANPLKFEAQKTAYFTVSKGKVRIEKHVSLPDTQKSVKDSAREGRASMLLGMELTLQTPDNFHWNMLTQEQKDSIDANIVGYEYEMI